MIEIKNTLFVGKVLYQYKSLESTNDLAKEILSKSKPPEGTAISTYNQTKGRGQIGSSWQSEPDKNITCSIILYPSFLKAQEQFLLSQVAALAIYNTVKCLTYKAVYVKWPNDVLIENRKVAGILIQNSLAGERLNETVIGIGLNVNQSIFSKFDTQPTSLKLESNKVFALEEVLNVLFSNIEKWYLDLKNNRFQKI